MNLDIFDHVTVLQVFGGLCLVTFAFVMIRAHFAKRNPIDLTDLITEYAAGKRRITMSRFTAFGGFLIGAWSFVSATVSNTLGNSWEGILAFMGICFGYRVSDSWLKNQRDAQVSESDVPVLTEEPPKKKGILS